MTRAFRRRLSGINARTSAPAPSPSSATSANSPKAENSTALLQPNYLRQRYTNYLKMQ